MNIRKGPTQEKKGGDTRKISTHKKNRKEKKKEREKRKKYGQDMDGG